MNTHTPGPWEWEYSPDPGHTANVIALVSGAHKSIPGRPGESYGDVLICTGTPDAAFGLVSDADARLIAAAPELLQAAKQAKKYLEPDLVEPGRTVFWKLVDAINKAEGKEL